MAHLNSDGGMTLDGVVLTKEQVREIKSAKPAPEKKTGWWIVEFSPGDWTFSPVKFISASGGWSAINGTANAYGETPVHVTGRPYFICWTTF